MLLLAFLHCYFFLCKLLHHSTDWVRSVRFG